MKVDPGGLLIKAMQSSALSIVMSGFLSHFHHH